MIPRKSSESNPENSLLLTKTTGKIQINIGRMKISHSLCRKLLGIKIDNKLIFKTHIRSIWKKPVINQILLQNLHFP